MLSIQPCGLAPLPPAPVDVIVSLLITIRHLTSTRQGRNPETDRIAPTAVPPSPKRPGTYAIVTPAYIGHLNPLTVLGQALQRRGHRVILVSHAEAASAADSAGLGFIPVARPEFPDGEWSRCCAELGRRSGPEATKVVTQALARFATGLLRDIPALAAQEHLDGMIMDQISIGAEAACQAVGLPLAVACSALLMHQESCLPPVSSHRGWSTDWPSRARNLASQLRHNLSGWRVFLALAGFRQRHHLGPMRWDHINQMPPSLVQVAQTPAFFDFPRRGLPSHFHYTGPWLKSASIEPCGFPWGRLNGKPLVYASLGTLQNGVPNRFRIVAEACATLDVQLVIALGQLSTQACESFPGSPVVVGYAPQRALLRRASLVITHGGLNTTLEALSAGVPIIALPIANDQPGVAARILALGVGSFLPISMLTAPRLRALVADLLSASQYRVNASACARKLEAIDGPARAAELVESAFCRGRR